MAQTIKIDPITRIEGHLGVEVEIEGGVVVNAKSMGMMFRGLELIMKSMIPAMRNRSCKESAESDRLVMPPRVRWL